MFAKFLAEVSRAAGLRHERTLPPRSSRMFADCESSSNSTLCVHYVGGIESLGEPADGKGPSCVEVWGLAILLPSSAFRTFCAS